MNDVREAINAWRAEHGLSQQDLAVIAGVSVITSGNWCRGSAVPTLANLASLEAARPGLVERVFGDMKRFEKAFEAGRRRGALEARAEIAKQLSKP